MDSLISVILVIYNGYKDTIECVESLKKIDYANYNIIVVDNGSTEKDDKAIDYLKDNTDYIYNPENCGFSGGNNIGIRHCREKYNSDFFLLLNNDTIVEKNFLNKLLLAYKENDNVGIVCGKILYYDYPDIIWFAGGTFDSQYAIADHCQYNLKNSNVEMQEEIEFATGCLMLIPKGVVEKVGVLDESFFLYAEDTDYSRKIRNAGYKIVYTSSAIIYHKVSRSSKSTSLVSYYMVRNNLYIIKRYASRKASAYFKYMIGILKAIIKGEMGIIPSVRGLFDFLRGIKGKKE